MNAPTQTALAWDDPVCAFLRVAGVVDATLAEQPEMVQVPVWAFVLGKAALAAGVALGIGEEDLMRTLRGVQASEQLQQTAIGLHRCGTSPLFTFLTLQEALQGG